MAFGALTRFPELAGIGVQVTHGFGAVDLLRREEPGTTGLDTRSADGPFEGPVLAQPSTQLSDRLMIGRAPPVITLVALDSRSSRTLPLTLLSGRPLLDPSLRAARSTGHRNSPIAVRTVTVVSLRAARSTGHRNCADVLYGCILLRSSLRAARSTGHRNVIASGLSSRVSMIVATGQSDQQA